MNMNQIQYALAVARYKNFSKAAERLFLSQPALSLQIKKLEQELGFSLFTRKAQGVAITPEGEQFFQDARTVETAWNQMLQNVSAARAKNRRHLRIAVSTRIYSNGLFDDIVDFFDHHPEIEATFVTEAGADTLSALQNGTLDIALDRLPPTQLLPDSKNFFSCELISEQQCFLVSPDSRMSAVNSLSFSNLEGTSFITGLENSMEDRSLKQFCRDYGISLGKLYRSDGITTVMDLVRSGKGITLGPLSFASHFGVRAIPLEPVTYVSLNFICLKERASTPEIALFKKHLLQACSRFGRAAGPSQNSR